MNKAAGGTTLVQYNGTSSMTGFTNLTFGTAIGVKASPRADYKVSSITVSKLAAGSTVPVVTSPAFTPAGAGQQVTVGVTVDQAVVEVSAAYELVASAKAMFSAPLRSLRKTMVLPSGENFGWLSKDIPPTIRLASPPAIGSV